MQVLLKLNNGELQLMTEENFETIHELKGISSYTILGWLHDKKPICNMCNDYLDDDSRPVGAQVMQLPAELWSKEKPQKMGEYLLELKDPKGKFYEVGYWNENSFNTAVECLTGEKIKIVRHLLIKEYCGQSA